MTFLLCVKWQTRLCVVLDGSWSNLGYLARAGLLFSHQTGSTQAVPALLAVTTFTPGHYSVWVAYLEIKYVPLSGSLSVCVFQCQQQWDWHGRSGDAGWCFVLPQQLNTHSHQVLFVLHFRHLKILLEQQQSEHLFHQRGKCSLTAQFICF